MEKEYPEILVKAKEKQLHFIELLVIALKLVRDGKESFFSNTGEFMTPEEYKAWDESKIIVINETKMVYITENT